MTKTFKVGDKVRLNDTFVPKSERGMETTISDVAEGGYFVVDTKDPESGDWFAYAEELDLIEDEIVPTAPANPVTKIDKIKAHLLSGRSLTQLEALGLYGAFRLAARIHDLKAQGWKIVSTIKEDPNGNPYAEYKLRTVKGRI